jgi:hypothetical protein
MNKTHTFWKYFCQFVISSALFFSNNAFALTFTSQGGLTNWTAAASWTGGVAGHLTPIAGDDVIIANGDNIQVTTNVASANITVQNGGAFVLNPTGTITISGNFVLNPTGMFGASGGTFNFSGAGIMNLTGSFNTNTIKCIFNVNSGTVVVTSGTIFANYFAGSFNLVGGSLQNNGDITCNSSPSINLAGGTTWIQEPNSRLVVYSNITGAGNFDGSGNGNNLGFYGGSQIFASSTSYYNVTLAYGGTFSLAGNTTVQNNFTISGPTTTNFNGNGFTLHLGGIFTDIFAGSVISNADMDFNGSGAMSIATVRKVTETFKKLTVSGTGTLTLGQNLLISGDVNLNAGTLSVSAKNYNITVGGNWTNNGGFFNSLSGTVTFNNSSPKTLSRTVAGSDRFNNFIIVNTSTFSLNADIAVVALSITSGTLNGGSNTINCHVSWSNTGGTFTPGTGTVALPRPGGTCTISKTVGTETFNNLTINAGVAATLSCPISCAGNLSITNGSLDAGAANNNISVGGNINVTATLKPRNATVSLIGASAQTVNITGAITFYNLVQNGAGGSTIQSGTYTISNSLSSLNGVLTNSGGTITLPSTAGSSAYIGSGAGSFSGNFKIQKFISARAANLMDLACPVTGSDLYTGWDQQMYISGIGGRSGNASPGYYSMHTYDETGTLVDDNSTYFSNDRGLIPVKSDITLANGVCYEMFVGDDQSNWNAKTLSNTGTPVSGTPIANLSYTPATSHDVGDNRIGNPFASHIDWNCVTKTNVSGTMYILVGGNYSSFTAGVCGGASVDIPSGQGFVVYATGGGASVSFPQACKIASTTTSFNGRYAAPFNLKMTLSSPELPEFYQENSLVFNDNAGLGFEDEYDAHYIPTSEPLAPSLYMISSDGKRLTRNAFNSNSEETATIPMKTIIRRDGNYKLATEGAYSMTEYSCVLLEDVLLHTVTNLHKETDYTFTAKTTDTPNRFILHLTRKAATCESILASVKSADLFLTENDVRIYSNYENAFVKFDLDQAAKATVSVYNTLGQKIMTDLDVDAFKETLAVSFAGQPSGFYILSVNLGGNHVITKKVMINHNPE